MPRSNAHKEKKEHAHAGGMPPHPGKEETMALLIRGLNTLIAHASSADMATASRILYTAKEELVHWAVNMDFHETAEDRFINHHLCDSGLLALGEFIARVGTMKDGKLKNEIFRLLGSSLLHPDGGANGNGAMIEER